MSRLDKDLFNDELLKIQRNVEQRRYAKPLVFAQELGEAIHTVVLNPYEPPEGLESSDSPKHSFADIRERRKLGKRILKAVQPQLEAALRIESDITQKPFETLQKELEARIEASLDVSKVDVTMQDGEADGNDPEQSEVVDGEAMDTDTGVAGNDEPEMSNLDIVNGDTSKDVEMSDAAPLTNGVHDSQTPPNSNGYGPSPHHKTTAHNGPPSPPQSNGSFGKDIDPLSDGGVVWYFQSYQPQGTTIITEKEAPAGAQESKSIRGQSEDLTDLDDEELKKLGKELGSDLKQDLPPPAIATPRSKKGKAPAVTSPARRRTSTRRR